MTKSEFINWLESRGWTILDSPADKIVCSNGTKFRTWYHWSDGTWSRKLETRTKNSSSPMLLGAIEVSDNSSNIQRREQQMAVRKRNQENDMSDEVTEEGTVATEAKAPKEKAPSKKVALPEGYVTPVDFAKQLSERNGEEVRPQVVYGYVKNMKEFPFVERDEAPRFMVKVPEAFDFLATKLAEKAAKKAAKAEADAAKASAPAEAPAE